MKIKEVAQDIIDTLPNEYRDNDSENENFEYFQSFKQSLNNMFGISLDDPDHYAEYQQEDDDFYTLSCDQYEEMIASWIAELKPLTESEDCFEFNNLPDLNEMFPKPITQLISDSI